VYTTIEDAYSGRHSLIVMEITLWNTNNVLEHGYLVVTEGQARQTGSNVFTGHSADDGLDYGVEKLVGGLRTLDDSRRDHRCVETSFLWVRSLMNPAL
jgi:hypothetical protein